MTDHLQFSHYSLPCILAMLFNIMLINGHVHVPRCFGESFTVPVLKSNNAFCKTLSVDDFRDIAISSVISKVFKHCILDRFAYDFITSDNQSGFKRNSGCSFALYTLRSVVDYHRLRNSCWVTSHFNGKLQNLIPRISQTP